MLDEDITVFFFFNFLVDQGSKTQKWKLIVRNLPFKVDYANIITNSPYFPVGGDLQFF